MRAALAGRLRDAERRLLSTLARNRRNYENDSDDGKHGGVVGGVRGAVLFDRHRKRAERQSSKEHSADQGQAHGRIIEPPMPAEPGPPGWQRD